MIELSTRTKASYTYVKDWMMLRECVAGCLGALQTTSHQNVKLKLRLPEGSPAKFVKISGALQITKRATGKDAEATLGDLRFGDKRGQCPAEVLNAASKPQLGIQADQMRTMQIFLSNLSLHLTIRLKNTSLRTLGKALFRVWKRLEVPLTPMSNGT